MVWFSSHGFYGADVDELIFGSEEEVICSDR